MLRRACFIAAGALIALTAVPSLAPAQSTGDPEAGRPTAFVASGEAFGAQVLFNTVPAQAIAEIINTRTPWVTTGFETGSTSNAVASLFDPGGAVTAGASLLCQVSGDLCAIPNFPPPYPLTARATNPLAVDATAQLNGDTVSIGPLSTTAGDARAHAGRDEVNANATVQGNTVGSGGAVLAKIGNSTANNRLSFGGDGTLIAEATAAVNDVTILGLLKIDSIEARVTSTAKGSGEVTNDVQLDIQGASIAGVPVTIDDKGLTLGAPTGSQAPNPLSGLGQALTPLLSAFRGQVRTLGTTDTKDETGASASATGVLVELFPNTDAQAGISPKISLILAFAGTHAYAYDAPPFAGGSGGSGGSSTSGSSSSKTGGGASSFTKGTPGTPSQSIAGSAGTAGSAGGGDSGGSLISSLLGGLAADRLKFFYLAWTLSMIGCALGSRLRPARLGALATTGGTNGNRAQL